MQIIYPVKRILAQPKILHAVANFFDGPDFELIADSFYSLLEYPILEESDPTKASFDVVSEVMFRYNPEDDRIFQIILPNGHAVELTPTEGEDYYAEINTKLDFTTSTKIYSRLVKAIVEAMPESDGDIALCDPPTPANHFLIDPEGDFFSGEFHLLSDPDQRFEFRVEILDHETQELKAHVRRI